MTGPKLITTEQVARMAGVKTQTIRCYRCRPGAMPEPTYIGSTPVWRVSEIRQWLRTRRAPGRPPKEEQ